MRRAIASLAICAVIACLAPTAHAAKSWTLREGSKIGFVSDWEGAKFDGVFHEFTADIAFDPEDLAGSRFDVDVDVTSADTQSRDRDEGLAEPEWFDYAHHQRATFVTSAFHALEGGRYEATGTLTIKGVSREIALPFSWQAHDATAQLHGEVTLKRTDFNVGEGEWAEDDTVGLDVLVKIDLALGEKASAD